SLQYVIINLVSSAAVAAGVLAIYPYAIGFAEIPWDGDLRLIRLLAISGTIAGATNGLIIISQFQGNAMRTSWILLSILLAKIMIGTVIVIQIDFEAMVLSDIVLGTAFFIIILVGT